MDDKIKSETVTVYITSAYRSCYSSCHNKVAIYPLTDAKSIDTLKPLESHPIIPI